jgi:phosphoglucomutase
MLAVSGRSLTELKNDLFREYGERVGGQKNISLTAERERALKRLLRNAPAKLDGRPVEAVETIDGLKLDLSDDDWLLLRLSGTEPLIRVYAEAGSKKEMRRLMAAGLELLG